jgi:hypothetical protein
VEDTTPPSSQRLLENMNVQNQSVMFLKCDQR